MAPACDSPDLPLCQQMHPAPSYAPNVQAVTLLRHVPPDCTCTTTNCAPHKPRPPHMPTLSLTHTPAPRPVHANPPASHLPNPSPALINPSLTIPAAFLGPHRSSEVWYSSNTVSLGYT